MIRMCWKTPTILAALVVIPAARLAADPPPPRVRLPKWLGWQVHWDNDGDLLSTGTDRYYTSGVHYVRLRHPELNWRSAERFSTWWCTRFCKPGSNAISGFTLGQDLYTPADLEAEELLPDDRSYAGHLYGSFLVAIADPGRNLLQNFELRVGMVGEEAGGEWVQRRSHNLLGSKQARGWENQLETEPTVGLTYLLSRRTHNPSRTFDVTVHAGGTLGTAMIHGGVGGTLRLGHNVSGFPQREMLMISPPARDRGDWEYYLYLGADGRLVGHNLFLTGNTMRQSRHPGVDAKPFVYELRAGVVVRYRNLQVRYAVARRSKEFTPPSGNGKHVLRSLQVSILRTF